MKSSLTDTFVKNQNLAGRYTDGSTTGLNLQVKQGGGKYWTYRYLFQGKRFDLSLGSYPSVSLKEARARAVSARSQVLQGQQPTASWRPVQPSPVVMSDRPVKTTFATYASACIESKRFTWSFGKQFHHLF